MKRVVFVLGLMLLSCSRDGGVERADRSDVQGTSAAAPESAVGIPPRCESEGGTCRKSRCRSDEVPNWDLECGTDAQCCVPVE